MLGSLGQGRDSAFGIAVAVLGLREVVGVGRRLDPIREQGCSRLGCVSVVEGGHAPKQGNRSLWDLSECALVDLAEECEPEQRSPS